MTGTALPALFPLFTALLLLLSGIFLLRKLWAGALAGVLFLLVVQAQTLSSVKQHFLLATTDAILIWTELAVLLFGAYFFYVLLDRQQQMAAFNAQIAQRSSGLSVVLLFAWFLGGLMEGVAGFGIPAMLVAPLLLSLGYKPLTCAVIPLAANTCPVTFGALGIALKLGIGVEGSHPPELFYVLALQVLPILLMPFVLAWLYSKTEGVALHWHREYALLLKAGLCFLVPYLAGSLAGIEYPVLLAGSMGMFTFVRLILPKEKALPARLWWATFWPYLFFVTLLIPASLWLRSVSWQAIDGGKNLSAFQPGLLFIAAGIFYQYLKAHSKGWQPLYDALKTGMAKMKATLLSILLLLFFTQLIKPEMTGFYQSIGLTEGWAGLIVLPSISGVAGSFITGSATMSNLLFASGLRELLSGNTLAPLAMAALHSGSAVGNAISLQNILMVKTVIPGSLQEAHIMRTNLPAVLAYWLCVVLTGLLMLLFRA
jgi:L-lactate permease